MAPQQEIVITGIGVISPIGIGKDAFAASLYAGRSGVRRLDIFGGDPALPDPIGAEVSDFDAKLYVRPRKALKVMSRDIQFGFAAADLACRDAGIAPGKVDPERLGVVFGADMIPIELDEMVAAYKACASDGAFHFDRWGDAFLREMFPLWMLKFLPNMPACHIGIACDARGPNNSLTVGEVSSLVAMAEAMRVLQRGTADVMVVGGASSRTHPTLLFRTGALDVSSPGCDPTTICRPFDKNRRGQVNGEGAGALILETRRHAEARGAKILARILGYGAIYGAACKGRQRTPEAIRKAITRAMAEAGAAPGDLGHVNANGVSIELDDRIEAQAIRDTLGDVPVTAVKSYFGNIGAATGAVEIIASVAALAEGRIPATLNYEYPDPACPVNVVRGQPLATDKRLALKINHAPLGQAVAMVLAGA